MATTAEAFKQEMPPEGGYRKLCFQRILPRRFFTLPKLLVIHIAPTVVWYYYYRINRQELFMARTENRSANHCLTPLIYAERDREFIRQIRRNRDEEAEVMKNYPGWEVGLCFGEPIFSTLPEDYFIEPQVSEYYIHTRLKYLYEWYEFRHYH